MIDKPASELAADVREHERFMWSDEDTESKRESAKHFDACLDALVARVTDLEDREENLCERLSICDIKLAKREARVADLEAQDAAIREHLREFNHVEGEPTSEIAAVAESTFGFLRHRVEAAEAQVAALTQERDALRESGETE